MRQRCANHASLGALYKILQKDFFYLRICCCGSFLCQPRLSEFNMYFNQFTNFWLWNWKTCWWWLFFTFEQLPFTTTGPATPRTQLSPICLRRTRSVRMAVATVATRSWARSALLCVSAPFWLGVRAGLLNTCWWVLTVVENLFTLNQIGYFHDFFVVVVFLSKHF